MASDVRFIRVHGRVVPIHGQMKKNVATGKKMIAKEAPKIQKKAVAIGNDHFNNDLNKHQQDQVRKGLHFAEHVSSGLGFTVGAGSALGAAALGTLGLKAANRALDSYESKAKSAKREYGSMAAQSGAVLAVSAPLAHIFHKEEKSAMKAYNIAKKFGSAESVLKDAPKALKIARGARFAKHASLLTAAVMVPQVVIGTVGYFRAKKHEERAGKLRVAADTIKTFLKG